MHESISQLPSLVPPASSNQMGDEIMENTKIASPSNIKRLSIIIPAYNEEKTIALILDRINEVKLIRNIEKEVIIVNDCSKDNTEQIIQNYISNNAQLSINYFKYIKHEKNQGKGAAIHTGISEATGEYLLVQDADLEYDPGEYNMLLKPIVLGAADVVYGSRFMGGNPHRILFFWHSIGNRFLTFLSNMFNNLNLTDMETGYKMFRTDIIQRISLKEKRFGFEPEVTAKVAMTPGVRIYEVGISYYGRTFAEGKKIGWRDGVRAIYCILKYGLFRTGTPVNNMVKVSK
jgi:glycosyltransferase involved in cell wall biosynthesis